jgi:hypothetical protein
MKNRFLILSLVLFFQLNVRSQDLLSLVEDENVTEKITNAFKSPRVINSHSMEMLAAGASTRDTSSFLDWIMLLCEWVLIMALPKT